VHQDLFTTNDSLSIGVATWNVEGLAPIKDIDLKTWLIPSLETTPDIFVIGL